MTNKIKILIGVNLLLVAAIGFSFMDFSSSTDTKRTNFFAIENFGDITQFDIDEMSIRKLEDGRWVLNDSIDIEPQKLGYLFQALQQTTIVDTKDKSLSDGKDIVIYISNTPVINAKIKSESDAASFGEINGETFAIEIPGQFVNIEQIFSPDPSIWRDKTIFKTSWKTLQKLEINYDRNPENNVDITFADPFYAVKGIQALDSAAVYQFITSLPQTKGFNYEFRESFVKDTVSRYKPFCVVKMKDLMSVYDTEVGVYPFENKVFAYFPDTKEVAELDTRKIQDVLVSWHFFDANDPRKRR